MAKQFFFDKCPCHVLVITFVEQRSNHPKREPQKLYKTSKAVKVGGRDPRTTEGVVLKPLQKAEN